MKNTSRKPYIYKVTNLENHQYYIGSQCSGKIIGVNYFTSSTNKEFWEDFKTYGEEKYKITIVKAFEDPDECGRVENYIIRNYMQKKDGLCLNKFYCCSGKKVFSRVGTHGWNKGIPRSEETRKKIGEARLGTHHSEETKQKMSEAKKGIPRSEETKQKMRKPKKGHTAWNKGLPSPKKGIPLSEEHKKKLSIAKKIKISIKNTVFDSLTEASKYYNVSVPTIGYWVKTKKHNAFYIEK